MSAQSLVIILRLISLMVFFRNGISSFLVNCEKAIIHFPEYKCRDQALFDRGANGITFVVFKDEELKILKVQEVNELNQLKKANTDVQFLRLFQGEKYIIQLFGSLIADGYLFELLEFGENGSLLSYFNGKREFFANKKNKLELFWKILQGVSTIHKKGVVHADLKLENIVIDDHSDPKIIDFDLSVTKGSEDYGRGTFEFMDPIIIENWGSKRTVYNEFRDIYSLGVILYYLDQGTYPFEGSTRFSILNSIKNNYYKFTQGTDYDIIMIVESCLKLNEKKEKLYTKL